MIQGIIIGVVVFIIAGVLRYICIHHKQFLGYPVRFWGWFTSKLKKKETEEEKKKREYREEMESDDPEKWKPVK